MSAMTVAKSTRCFRSGSVVMTGAFYSWRPARVCLISGRRRRPADCSISTIGKPVVSENANGAKSSNPRGVLEICGDQPTRHWVCDSPLPSNVIRKKEDRVPPDRLFAEHTNAKRSSAPVLSPFVFLDTKTSNWRTRMPRSSRFRLTDHAHRAWV